MRDDANLRSMVVGAKVPALRAVCSRLSQAFRPRAPATARLRLASNPIASIQDKDIRDSLSIPSHLWATNRIIDLVHGVVEQMSIRELSQRAEIE